MVRNGILSLTKEAAWPDQGYPEWSEIIKPNDQEWSIRK